MGCKMVKAKKIEAKSSSGKSGKTVRKGLKKTSVSTGKKPTYEALEKRIIELEKAAVQKDKLMTQLQESEKKYKTIFENTNDEIIYVNTKGVVVEVNATCERFSGWSRDELKGKHFTEFGFFSKADWGKCIKLFEDAVDKGDTKRVELEAFRKDGTPIFVEIDSTLVEENGEIKGAVTVMRDATERKQAREALKQSEENLRQHRDHLEDLVGERTVNLEEANTALKVLLKRREEDKHDLEKKMLLNVKELVLPFMEKLRNSRINEKQKVFVDIMEFNLNDIISPFVKEMSSKYLNLTATEIRIANIIKQGKSTKEIADLLNMSARTIDIHRYNIRKKLGLNNKKAGLATYLLSLR